MNRLIRRLSLAILILIPGCGRPETSVPVTSPAPAATPASAQTPAPSTETEIVVTDKLLSFDPATVRLSASALLGLGLGSAKVEAFSRADGVCSFDFTHEIEMGYTKYRVEVPTDSGMVTIREGPDGAEVETSFDITKAKVLKVGRLLP